MKDLVLLAGDTGKSSCRLVSGRFDGNRLSINMEGRFDLYQAFLPDGWLYLDIVNVFAQLKLLLAKFSAKTDVQASSFGIETWGGDFGLLDRNLSLINLPIFFKDPKLTEHFPAFLKSVDMREIFYKTGMDAAPYNSPVRLFIKKMQGHTDLKNADRFLGIADLLSFFFSGRPVSELTSISVTRMIDLATNTYSRWLLDEMGIDNSILKNEIVMPGTIIGSVLPGVGSEIGNKNLKIAAVPGHDTTASILAAPELDENSVFFGSGTTMVYCYVNQNLNITDEMYRFNPSIVKGFGNTNITVRNFNAGMWLMHAMRRDWPGGIEYGQMYALAENAKPFQMYIDIDSAYFETWGNVTERIVSFCELTEQQVTNDAAQFVRCIVESYAMKGRWCLDQYEQILGHRVDKLVIVGGGVYSDFLCQMMADATGRQVVTGAAEATSIGNILSQLYALGELSSVEEMQQIVRNSFDVKYFEPAQMRSAWEEAYIQYMKVMDKFHELNQFA